jgi:hypothetical protein
MQVRADTWFIGHDRQNVITEVLGVAGDETEPLDCWNGIVDLLEQIGKARSPATCCMLSAGVRLPERFQARADLGNFSPIQGHCGAVGVSVVIDGLAQQGDFKHALISQLLALSDDFRGWSVDFGPAGMWDHAVGAELVAAPGDTNVSTSSASLCASLWVEGSGEIQNLK